MNKVHRIVAQDLLNEIIWLKEQAMRARAKRLYSVAETWDENAYRLLREIGGFE